MSSNDVRDDQLPRGAGSAGEVPAQLAASVIVCRGEPFEILLLQRNSNSSFVPDAWIFPGGALDDSDREAASALGESSTDAALRVCAVRETLEESGIWLGAREHADAAAAARRRLLDDASIIRELDGLASATEALTPTSHWITPFGVPKRYDTWFYLARVDADAVGEVDALEMVRLLWVRPEDALKRHHAGELGMVFPTIKNIEALLGFDSFDALVASRRGVEIPAIQPLLISDGFKKRLVLPDER